MSVIVVGLVLLWVLSPGLRVRLESPKYRMLERERRFSERRGSDARARRDGGEP